MKKGTRKKQHSRACKDAEVRAFIDRLSPRLSLFEMACRCRDRFGSERGPSKSAIHRYIHRKRPENEVAQGPAKKSRLWRDAEVEGLFRKILPEHSIIEAVKICRQVFGLARTPSKSTVSRYFPAARNGMESRKSRKISGEIARFLLAHWREFGFCRLAGMCRVKFGPGKAPSKSAIHRFLSAIEGYSPNQRQPSRCRSEEINTFILQHRNTVSIVELSRILRARFGPGLGLSKSSIYRHLQSIKSENEGGAHVPSET